MPFNFEAQKISQRILVLSANKQANYGTSLADASLTRRQKYDGSGGAELVPTRYTDKAMAGKGTEWAANGFITAWDSKVSFKTDLDDWLAGWLLAFALGKETVTGGAAPYTHAIAVDESTTQAPVTTLYFEDTNDVKWKAPDMAVTDITLTIPQNGPIGCEVAMMGTGKWVDGAMVAGPPALVSYNYLLGSDTIFSIGAIGALVSKVGRHLSSTIKFSTGVINHKAPGLGLFGAFMRTGSRKISFQTTIAANIADDVRTIMNNDTQQELQWATTSGASQMNIVLPNVRLKTNKLAANGNMIVWNIEGDETTMFNQGGLGVITASVVNSVPAYLVGA